MLALMLVACGFEASGSLIDSAAEVLEPSGEDSAVPDDTGDTEAPDPLDEDDDGDGLSENEGDCDDTDGSVHPGAVDLCDGDDDDCDGEVDEDAEDEDPYEPNDDDPHDLGTLESGAGHEVAAFLHNDQDDDRFSFYVEDSWIGDAFPVTITLANIPSSATYKLTVNRLSTDGSAELGLVDEDFGSGSLTIVLEDSTGPDDGGVYEVVVGAIANADCGSAYLLTAAGE